MKPHKLILDIDLTYAAFDDDASLEVGRILANLATDLLDGDRSMTDLLDDGLPMIDINGNTVGRARIVEEV